MLTYLLLIITLALSDRGADIWPLLRAQGFEWTLEKADARVQYIGDISKAGRTYSIYLYNAVNRDSGHGVNLFILMLNKSTFLGVHEAGSAHDCRIQRDAVVCKSDFPGMRIKFTDNGPPLMLWFDGYYEKFWFAPKFRTNIDDVIGQLMAK